MKRLHAVHAPRKPAINQSDFTVCSPDAPCARQLAQILWRLEELKRTCREEQHTLTYADLNALEEPQ